MKFRKSKPLVSSLPIQTWDEHLLYEREGIFCSGRVRVTAEEAEESGFPAFMAGTYYFTVLPLYDESGEILACGTMRGRSIGHLGRACIEFIEAQGEEPFDDYCAALYSRN